jgi:hypothetical protein
LIGDVLRDGTTLDEPGYFEKFIETHLLLNRVF